MHKLINIKMEDSECESSDNCTKSVVKINVKKNASKEREKNTPNKKLKMYRKFSVNNEVSKVCSVKKRQKIHNNDIKSDKTSTSTSGSNCVETKSTSTNFSLLECNQYLDLSHSGENTLVNAYTNLENFVVKQETLDHDVPDLDLLVPKIELHVSETEFKTDDDDDAVTSKVDDDVNSKIDDDDIFKVVDDDDDDDDTFKVDDDSESNDRLGYRCPYCYFSSTYRQVFSKHLKVTNIDAFEVTSNDTLILGTYTCSICNTKFSNQAIFEHHMKTHKIISCDVCNYISSYECDLLKHQHHKRHNLSCLQCYICNENYDSDRTLRDHFLRSHIDSDIKYLCQLCKVVFKTKTEMFNHCKVEFKCKLDINLDYGVFRHINLNCNSCDTNNCSDDGPLIQIGVKKMNQYYCMCCDYRYSSIYYLNQHFVLHHVTYTAQNLDSLVCNNNSSDNSILGSVCAKTISESEANPPILLNDCISNDQNYKYIKKEPEEIFSDSQPLLDQQHFPNLDIAEKSEFIVPDITDQDSVLPFPSLSSSLIVPTTVEMCPKPKSNVNTTTRKQCKIKTMQLKVSNTKSQICSVDMQQKSTTHCDTVDHSLKTFFENSARSVIYSEPEKQTGSKNTKFSAPSIYCQSKRKSDQFWCNFCQCSVSSDHDQHSDSKTNTLRCNKCSFQSLSIIALKRHIKNAHIKGRNIGKVVSSKKNTTAIDDKPIKKARDRTIRYNSTPKTFANPCAQESFAILEKQFNKTFNSKSKQCYEEIFFFHCLLCDTVYDKYEVYVDHFSIHDIKKPVFNCIICDKKFNVYTFSVFHFKKHVQTKVHCTVCRKDIQINEFFGEHSCIEKQCSFCCYELEDKETLSSHSREHIAQSNSVHKCNKCKYYFYTLHNLEKHFINVHKSYYVY